MGLGCRTIDPGAQLLDWTTCPDGRPHCVPVWGVWPIDNAFYFSSGAKSRKARNLAANPNAWYARRRHRGGFARRRRRKIIDVATIRRFVEAYNPKYQWDLKAETVLDIGPIFAVHPRKVIAVDATPGQFQGSATRWLLFRIPKS